jgi:membrane fusion protein (multidrug efflux system)
MSGTFQFLNRFYFWPIMSKQIVSVFFALVLIACNSSSSKENKPAAAPAGGRPGSMPVQAEAYVVKTRVMSEDLEVPGTLLPYEETEIRPEISGRLVELNIREGAFVNKGTLLAKLFDGDLQAQLQKLQVQLQISEKTVDRYKELLKIQGISQQEYDLAELQVNNLKADMDVIRVDISRTQIRAPYSGKLGLRNVSIGAYVSPTSILTTLRKVDQLKVSFTVPEKYSALMQRGKTVKLNLEGEKQKFTATILATENSIEANTRTLKVLAVVNAGGTPLVPGAFAKVNLQMGKNNEAIVVPTQSIIPQARNKKVLVYNNGQAKSVIVETGIRDSSYVQIESGLNLGDTVLTTGLLAVRPDSKVRLIKVQ